MYCILPERGLIRIAGSDAAAFLQGLVSNDVTRLQKEKIQYAALLSPQGKFLHDFFLIDDNDAILIDCEKSRIPDLLQRLKTYRLRSQITIDTLPDTIIVAALWKDPIAPAPEENFKLLPDPRLSELGFRMIGDRAAIEAWCVAQNIVPTTAELYEKKRIELSIPDGSRDLIEGKTLLLECGFEALHGVDFQKGCYVGQEVTARSKFRAQLKKSLYKIESGAAELPPSGTAISAGETPIGELHSVSGSHGLAILRMEDVDKAGDNLRAGENAIKASLPPWMEK